MNRGALALVLLAVGGAASAGPAARAPRPTPPAQRPAAPPAATPVPTAPAVVARPAGEATGVRTPARVADTRRIVGILDIRVEGVPDEVRESFQRDLEDQFDVKQYWLTTPALMKQQLARSTKWTEGCVVGACLAELRAQTGAELVLLVALTGAGTSFGHVITLVRTDTGRVLAQDSDRCDVCRVSEATTKATLATVGLLNQLPDHLPDEAAEQAAATERAVGAVRRDAEAADQHTTRIGLVLTALGLATAATGIALYETAGHQPTYAAMTAAGGGALALGGIVVLAF